jgi:hypothetical protein
MMIPGSIDFEAFREQWLLDIVEDDPSTVELGRRFAHKLIQQWRDVDDSSSDLVYCDGAGDGGVDIAYLDRGEDEAESEDNASGHTWYLVQSKYGSAFLGSSTLLIEGQKVLDTLDGKRLNLSSLSEGLLERLMTFRNAASEQDRIVLLFATEYALKESQKRVLDDLRSMGRARLGPIFEVESLSIQTIYQRTLEEADANALNRQKVLLNAALVASGPNLLVGSTSLINLYEFLKAYRNTTEDLDQLYEKNVRRFLGARGKVNKGMQETLRSAPEQFGLYNNGITIVVTDFTNTGDKSFQLVEPYIVNGCQTTRTIWEVCHIRLDSGGTGSNPEIEAWREKAAQGVVVTKIVKVGNVGEKLLEAITRYTNSQNAVREKDFLALTSDFKTWARQMAERHKVYLEIQRGGWESRRALQKQHPDLPEFKEMANAFDLLKVYGAGWLGEAGQAFGKNPPFLPNGAIFKRIINQEGVAEGEPFGVDDLYASYLLKSAADKYGFGRGAHDPSRRQTRFLYYLVVLDLLREVLSRGSLSTDHHSLSSSLIKLFQPENVQVRDALLDTAIEVISTYLTQGNENSLFDEPAYKNYPDMNGYLKWEKLGKSEADSPRLRALLAVTKMFMGQKMAGHPSQRELILSAVKAQSAFGATV